MDLHTYIRVQFYVSTLLKVSILRAELLHFWFLHGRSGVIATKNSRSRLFAMKANKSVNKIHIIEPKLNTVLDFLYIYGTLCIPLCLIEFERTLNFLIYKMNKIRNWRKTQTHTKNKENSHENKNSCRKSNLPLHDK